MRVDSSYDRIKKAFEANNQMRKEIEKDIKEFNFILVYENEKYRFFGESHSEYGFIAKNISLNIGSVGKTIDELRFNCNEALKKYFHEKQ